MSVGFHKPVTVEAALALLAADPEARPLSGGQTLVPIMNLDLFRPSAIVSLNGIAELAGITAEVTGAVRIGARASHASLAASTVFKAGQSLIPLTAAQIAHPAVRQAGRWWCTPSPSRSIPILLAPVRSATWHFPRMAVS